MSPPSKAKTALEKALPSLPAFLLTESQSGNCGCLSTATEGNCFLKLQVLVLLFWFLFCLVFLKKTLYFFISYFSETSGPFAGLQKDLSCLFAAQVTGIKYPQILPLIYRYDDDPQK